MMPDRALVLPVLGVAAVLLLALGLWFDHRLARRHHAEMRLARYCLRQTAAVERLSVREALSRNLSALVGPLIGTLSAALFARERDRAEMRRLLWAAGYRGENALAMLALAKIAALLVGGAAGWLLVGGGAPPGELSLFAMTAIGGGGIGGAILPEIALRTRRDARKNRLRASLPDVIDLMVIAAYAGQSLDMALDRVGREMRSFAPDIAEELIVTCAELQALPDRTDALRNFAERLDLKEARAFALTIIQTIRYGSPFTDSLKALGADLRQARVIAAEERGAKLPALLTLPLIIFIMPAVFVVVVGPAVISVIDMLGTSQ
jgi:tight adherence protein C